MNVILIQLIEINVALFCRGHSQGSYKIILDNLDTLHSLLKC